MILQSKRWVIAAVLLGSVLLGNASVGQSKPREQAGPQTPNRQRIGNVTFAFGQMQIKARRAASITLDFINGPEGAKNAEFTSKFYDMAAPRISVEIRDSRMYTGIATGGVRVEVRQDMLVDKKPTRRVTNLQGDKATYYAAVPAEKGTPGKPAQIVITGNVRGTMRSPEFSATDPLNIAADSVEVKFIDSDTITIDAINGKGSGTPMEREPKPKANP